MAMVTSVAKSKAVRILKVVCFLSVLLAVTAPFWVAYLLGYGGYEQLVITAFFLVVVVVVASLGVFVWGFLRFLYCLLRYRSVSNARPFLLALAVILLVFVLPKFIAISSKKLGANHRLKQLGGDTAYAQLLQTTGTLLSNHVSETIPCENLPEIFQRLGVKRVNLHRGSDAHVDAVTFGRPFRTGWIIYSDPFPKAETEWVEVRPGLYRY